MPSFGSALGLAWKAATGIFSDKPGENARNLLTGVLPGGLGPPPQRNTQDFLRAYSEMPWLRAVGGRVATAVARSEWQLFVRRKSGGKARRDWTIQRSSDPIRRRQLLKEAANQEDLTEIVDHPLLDLIHDANSFHTGEQMRKVTQLHIDLVGEAFWLKERDGMGMVVGIWPIPPNWVINTPTPANPNYRVQFRTWRGLIPDTEFLWFCDTDPLNPYGRGTGTTQALGDELETDEYTAKHTKAFFWNRAKPDLLIYPKEGTVHGDQIKRLEEDWLSKSQGFWRAFKPYFMTREVGIHEMDQNFRAMQLVQLREFERSTIIQVFGIPPEILGVLENSNRSTINAADYLFSRYVVQPRLEFLRAALQERLVPEFDERLIIDYVSPVKRDEGAEAMAAQSAPWALSVDEWRARMGADPLPNGKGEVHIFTGRTHEHTMGEEDEMPTAGVPGGPEEGDPPPGT